MKPEIIYDEDGVWGQCPVQASGRINGHPFYFRSRGGHWSLEINPIKSDPVDYCGWTSTEVCWRRREVYSGKMAYRDDEINDGHRFAAGWAEEAECVAFIEESSAIWAKEVGA